MNDIIKLDNQLCFALYTANRKMTQMYKPLLDPLNLTYPQYLVMMVLLEEDHLTVKALGDRLYLDSGTLTPLLKRMEKHGFVTRVRSSQDERKVFIQLTDQGRALEEKMIEVPKAMCYSGDFQVEDLIDLRETLKKLIKEMT